jgi:chloride channel protein, CIC family
VNDELNRATLLADAEGSLLILSMLALVVGAISGVTGALFRVLLEEADQMRDLLIVWAHGQRALGLLFVLVACTLAVALAAWLVHRFSPQASGSGIPPR